MILKGAIIYLSYSIIFRGTTSFTRRSCQTVLSAHLLSIVRVIAPILPHLAEDVWQNLPFQYTLEDGSTAEFVFESKWPMLNERWLAFPVEEIDFWGKILEVILVFTHLQLNSLSFLMFSFSFCRMIGAQWKCKFIYEYLVNLMN